MLDGLAKPDACVLKPENPPLAGATAGANAGCPNAGLPNAAAVPSPGWPKAGANEGGAPKEGGLPKLGGEEKVPVPKVVDPKAVGLALVPKGDPAAADACADTAGVAVAAAVACCPASSSVTISFGDAMLG